MAISKVILNNNVLMDVTGTTAISSHILAPYKVIGANGQEITGTLKNNSNWVRPVDWPDYDKLRLWETKEESLYFTYDNRIPGGYIILHITPKYYVQRVRIENNGSVTILSSSELVQNHYEEAIPIDAGDWVCYRVIPEEGQHLLNLNHENLSVAPSTNWANQLCVERYGYLPATTWIGSGYSYRDWFIRSVQSETLFGLLPNISINYSNSTSLQNLYIDSPRDLKFQNCFSLTGIDWNMVLLNTTRTSINSLIRASSLKEADFSKSTLTSITDMGYFAADCKELRKVKLPKGDYSGLTTNANAFQNCECLEYVDFPSSYTLTISQSMFSSCYTLRYLIFRANSVVPLGGTGYIPAAVLNRGGTRIYVPSAQIESYKTASNWSTLYATYPDMFGAIEGSAFE